MTYLETIAQRYGANSHHSFVLHGATRDLQLGESGSCSLTEHISANFAQMDRLVATYRVGIGWRFALESARLEFCSLVGLEQSNSGDFSALGVESDIELPLETAPAIGLIDVAMRQSNRAIVIVIDRAELVCPNSGYDRMSPSDKAVLSILQSLAADSSVAATGNLLILITDSLTDLAESLRLASSRYFAIEILPPSYDERLQIADQVLPRLAESGITLELTAPEFSSATSMLTRYGLMDVLQSAQQSGALTKDQVREVKTAVLSQEYGDVIESLEPVNGGFNAIAGMDALKAFFRANVIHNMIAANYADVPSGILLAGAAGLGKSFFMRAVAYECGLPVINFNVGRLLGSFVGQSERNLERALTAIRSAAPCLVVLDEIETTFPDRASAAPSGDSGVSSRILKRMLEVLSDPALRGRICWIGITNYPQKLDAALSRAGRFDVSVAFLPPTKAERLALIELYAAKYALAAPLQPETWEKLAERTNGYTPAELENVIRKVRAITRNVYGDEIDQLWLAAPDRVRPNTRDVQSMTDSALAAVNDSDLLPPEYIERWKRVTGQMEPASNGSGSAPAPEAKRRLF